MRIEAGQVPNVVRQVVFLVRVVGAAPLNCGALALAGVGMWILSATASFRGGRQSGPRVTAERTKEATPRRLVARRDDGHIGHQAYYILFPVVYYCARRKHSFKDTFTVRNNARMGFHDTPL